MNNAGKIQHGYAVDLCASETGGAPEWFHLLPVGAVEGRDGRAWVLDDPDGLIAAFQSRRVDLPIDVEHQSQTHKDTRSGPVPAAGWIKQLERRATGIWGRVAWTDEARALISKRAYRYISPHFFHTKDKRIAALGGAGLVHTPNLYLSALASQETTMDIPLQTAKLAEMLDLPPSASIDEIMDAIKALVAQEPDPEKYVPIEALNSAMQERNTRILALRDRDVESKVSDALTKGHITPAMKDWATALCTQNPASFDAFVGQSVAPFEHLHNALNQMTAPPDRVTGERADNERAASVCRQLGLPDTALNT